jgi:hypothetical protein
MTKHIPVALTPQQRDNLAILADVLASPERRRALAPDVGFDMADYRHEHDSCGTVACAAGWGPIAGIAKRHKFGGWLPYCAEAFGAGVADLGGNYELHRYLFGGDWCYVDQSPEGAANRIRTVLADGIPLDWDEGDEWQRIDYSKQLLPTPAPTFR